MSKERDDPAQSARFIEKARELGTNDDPAAFDALFGKLVPPILPTAKKPKSEDQAE